MEERRLKKARILIVDDLKPNVELLEYVVQSAGFQNCKSTTDPRQVLSLCNEFKPDLLVLDLHMPHLDGLTVLKQLTTRIQRPEDAGTPFPILVLTADTSDRAKQEALSTGAKDFVCKPFNAAEILLRIRNLLETRFLQLQLQRQNQMLEEKVDEKTRELKEAQIETLQRLALAAEFRDDCTGQHTQRVGQLSAIIGRAIGLDENNVELIQQAAQLHDVGKIGIPDHILLKPGKLTPEEFEQVKTHTLIGVRILSGSHSRLLQLAEEIVLYHHEHWDGTGYAQLCGDQIPLIARIVTTADVFDVLTHERAYKKAWTTKDALDEVEHQSGRLLDPYLVRTFLDDGAIRKSIPA